MKIMDLSKIPTRGTKTRPLSDICAIILHTTGYGPGVSRLDAAFAQGKVKDVGEAFALRQRDVLRFRPHFLVGRDGTVFQIMPQEAIALHTGSENHKRLDSWPIRNRHGKHVNPNIWRSLFTRHHAPCDTPADLPLWPRPNAVTLGVDLLEPADHKHPEAQLQGLVGLLTVLCQERGLGVGRIFTHSMVDPIDRTNARGLPWDLPDSFPLARLLDTVQARLTPKEPTP